MAQRKSVMSTTLEEEYYWVFLSDRQSRLILSEQCTKIEMILSLRKRLANSIEEKHGYGYITRILFRQAKSIDWDKLIDVMFNNE